MFSRSSAGQLCTHCDHVASWDSCYEEHCLDNEACYVRVSRTGNGQSIHAGCIRADNDHCKNMLTHDNGQHGFLIGKRSSALCETCCKTDNCNMEHCKPKAFSVCDNANVCFNNGTCVIQNDHGSSNKCLCVEGYTGPQCAWNIDDCVNVTCNGDHTKCVDQVNGYTCVCKEGYAGLAPICRDIDECALNPCLYGATCENLVNAFHCHCPPGYTGKNCENNVDECSPNPCQNGGTCYDGINSYTCQCGPGFEGDDCYENIQECTVLNISCKNGATCVDRINTFHCECASGWTGTYCDQDINECVNNPCLNGATCHNLMNNFTCSCPTGFDGWTCSVNINDCRPNLCKNGGTCVDGVNSFKCACPPDWMGPNCTNMYDVCTALSPCHNEGTCQTTPPSHDYICACSYGFTGTRCESNINDCLGNICQSFEHCYDGIGNYTCACPLGYTGVTCDIEIDECQSSPCKNGGTCYDGLGEYTCKCQSNLVNLTKYTPGRKTEFMTGWMGENCDVDINECSAPVGPVCLNNGICRNNDGSYTCYCSSTADSFAVGFNCEQTSSYCSYEEQRIGQPPCQNGGTCVDSTPDIRIQCLCAQGYTGARCQHDIDECRSQPCLYNGTCVDGINGYQCVCIHGLTGVNCEINVNECWPANPCLNYGRCIDGINQYECDCTDTGFNGSNCEHNINDCVGTPCFNGGTCVDGIKDYACACSPAATGLRCETYIDGCTSAPCLYNGTCVERTLTNKHTDLGILSQGTMGYMCQCIPGITGPSCEINIDDCENRICENGGTCVDNINSYHCECAPGYSGQFCDTSIN